MNWKDNITFSDSFKLLYKGVDIGVSREFIEDLKANTVMVPDDAIFEEFERIYNSKISVIRNKKIDDILS